MAGLKEGLIKRGLRGIGADSIGGAANIGMNGYFLYDGYTTARENGSGVVGSIASGVVDTVLPNIIGWKKYMGFGLALQTPELAITAMEEIDKYGRKLNKQSNAGPFSNATFVDNQQIYTMRQAGMALAQQSKYNVQQTMLGNEARYMHR